MLIALCEAEIAKSHCLACELAKLPVDNRVVSNTIDLKDVVDSKSVTDLKAFCA